MTAEAEVCPEGYFCERGVTTALEPDQLTTAGNMEPCPNGHWCPEATGFEQSVAGSAYTVQPCRDGVICAQDATASSTPQAEGIGSLDPYGYTPCTLGNTCE